MESLTVTIAKLIRRHPISTPYVLACGIIILILGFHPW